ncbi:MAG TPA: Gfo/Idh/MocA family oxidoreductase [Pseudonocardia sp.]|jgi:myo-inositol 2-dehydrogenase/D-chiro-inositol 1-dehydrogenase|uniref:Gfo/Idh/MocA family protein n=1 Tax=Pseudonocardia sp. TaxID=60912 RepID=UPI002B4AE779|nr:Gfo/Idh/MocA family oxidoreductase [Pseudonocardia sp.]HLU58490.1 Gfo/Idh/MocA family oxidoreductase [Pseudonocardia sp.]
MRLGLIGLGRIGAFHAQTLAGLDAVDSLVVTDAVPALTKEVAERVGAEPVGSVAELLAAGVDGVLVAAATDTHPELVLAAVEAGLPVFCEKPLARAVDDAVAVARRVQESGVPVQVGYPRRFDPAFRAARAAVESGELGGLHTVRSTTLDPAPPPAEYLAASGGIFRDCAVHDFDAVRWVTGREVVEVYATGSDRGDPLFRDLDDVHTAAAILTLDDGTLGVVSNSRGNPRGYDVRLELHGTADSVAAGLDDGLPLRSLEPGVTFPAGPAHGFFMDRFAAAFRAELAAFTEVVAGTRPSPCTVQDALEVAFVAEAATLSRQQHRPVRLDEVRP